MKVVLDTNVWLDWLVFEDPSADTLARVVATGRLELLATDATRAEWLDVIERPKFALGEAKRAAIAARYDSHATLVAAPGGGAPLAPPSRQAWPPGNLLLCRDPDDQKFLDLALLAGAGFLVTRDRALLDLGRPALRHHALVIARPDTAQWRDALTCHL